MEIIINELRYLEYIFLLFNLKSVPKVTEIYCFGPYNSCVYILIERSVTLHKEKTCIDDGFFDLPIFYKGTYIVVRYIRSVCVETPKLLLVIPYVTQIWIFTS